ncbi:peptidylprolyl isomerase [Cohnella sp. CFH 77786]|uniref:peptidylprolyl isomerase n=1 Tax=Cohnella sp. CFH 77786 TaxID=2662265 RepID=UPI001C6093B6|nr:peptidylprolyl isomerase [Cohnella sp. CFH 77786]MBW5449041.1 peptidylprolyl isomerase [Cohnella sp. CFH 77786]
MLHPKRASARRTALLVLAAVLLAALLAGCGKKNEKQETGLPGAGQGKVIATYKGGEVTEGEFDKYTAFMEVSDPQTAMYLQIPQFKEQFVRQWALYKVLAGRASADQAKAADEDVKKFETDIGNALKTNADLKKTLDEKKLTVDEMKRIVKVLAAGNQIAKAKSDEFAKAVTDAEIKAEYDKVKSDYNIDTVRHVLVATTDLKTGKQLRTDEEALKRAKEVKDKLEKGGDWKTIAKEYSDDEGSKDNGGLYEKQQSKGWVTEFKNAANTQPIGVIGDPVKTQYGYHVMKVESREETPYDKLAQADKDQLKQTVVNAKVQDYLQAEDEKLDIKVTLPAEPSPSPSASPTASPSGSPAASPTATPSSSPTASATASK